MPVRESPQRYNGYSSFICHSPCAHSFRYIAKKLHVVALNEERYFASQCASHPQVETASEFNVDSSHRKVIANAPCVAARSIDQYDGTSRRLGQDFWRMRREDRLVIAIFQNPYQPPLEIGMQEDVRLI